MTNMLFINTLDQGAKLSIPLGHPIQYSTSRFWQDIPVGSGYAKIDV